MNPKNPKEKIEKRLFENVNKYLYDTPKRTRICMQWVSSNCDISFKKGKQEAQKEFREIIDDFIKSKEYITINIEEDILKELLSKLDNSPSQQVSVDKREIDVVKKISDVGENPILDTNNKTGDKK